MNDLAEALRQEIAPLGQLSGQLSGQISRQIRVAINYGNSVLAARNPQTGELSGISVDLAIEACKQLRLTPQFVPFDTAGKAFGAIASGQIDLAFLARDPLRAKDIAYTPPYVVIEGAYMVRQSSHITNNESVDTQGISVVVGANSAYDLFLTRELKSATLIRVETSQLVADTFLNEHHDVAAGVKQQLELDLKRVSNVRLLPGKFMVIEQAMAVPVGRTRAQAWLSQFIEEMKASGFVANRLLAHGIEGAAVAPAG
jgi:polar amino acid transport system substrate-binding protein